MNVLEALQQSRFEIAGAEYEGLTVLARPSRYLFGVELRYHRVGDFKLYPVDDVFIGKFLQSDEWRPVAPCQ